MRGGASACQHRANRGDRAAYTWRQVPGAATRAITGLHAAYNGTPAVATQAATFRRPAAWPMRVQQQCTHFPLFTVAACCCCCLVRGTRAMVVVLWTMHASFSAADLVKRACSRRKPADVLRL